MKKSIFNNFKTISRNGMNSIKGGANANANGGNGNQYGLVNGTANANAIEQALYTTAEDVIAEPPKVSNF